MVTTLLDGSSAGRFKFAEILDALWERSLDVPYRANDKTRPDKLFTLGVDAHELEHACPTIRTWAVKHVASALRHESATTSKPSGGLHLRATRRTRATAPSSRSRTTVEPPRDHGVDDPSQQARGSGVDEAVEGVDDEPSHAVGLDIGTSPEPPALITPAVAPSHRSPRDDLVSWKKISEFTLRGTQKVIEGNSPILWCLLEHYDTAEGGVVHTVRRKQYRPKELVRTGAIASLVFSRNNRASLYPLCRGIWLFACKAHQSIYRVESRLGLSVSYETTRQALRTAADVKMQELKDALESGLHFIGVGDNVQAYVKQRDHRIGRRSTMIKGFAGTAVQMEDCDPTAFNIEELLRREALLERKTLTPELIKSKIDWTHLKNTTTFTFLECLVRFCPSLSDYIPKLEVYLSTTLKRHQISQTRHSKVFPLASNSADEMHIQGMKQAVDNFLGTQMGIDESNLDGRILILSGDGKTFDQLLRLKRLLISEDGDFASLRCLVPLLELWHTKWTDLCRSIRAGWGKDAPSDPSTLARFAKETECPTPSDLRKVDFYDGEHILNLALDSHILVIWERWFGTTDLVAHFETLADSDELPSFERLLEIAEELGQRHASTKGYEQALKPDASYEHAVDVDPEWIRPEPAQDIEMTEDTPEDAGDAMDTDALSDLSGLDENEDTNHPDRDTTLANGTLFIRNAVWWRAFNTAVKRGDTGRVLEILKVWIFTFAGSGNPYYCQYLLELFCNFTWEWPPALVKAILDNWLVNLKGRRNGFTEMDLMQEHHNFWLEDMAQHKGHEFDDDVYRKVLSICVREFLNLKDVWEDNVELEERTKAHSAPHTNNELRAGMKFLHMHKVHVRVPGRSEGFFAKDDFAAGVEILHTKINSFITRTTTYRNVFAPAQDGGAEESSPSPDIDEDDWPSAEREELDDYLIPDPAPHATESSTESGTT
ncbi:hypothetical protein OF83DRAFT_1069420 [Amylostereum chailletii]|nr:hypothetical protein OF83DRAFT_1069420 [Amylostereum chailletii]